MKDKNIIAIIPARGGSKGIPGKNIMNFCDKPLIAWSIEQARASLYVKDIYVTSDDRQILDISRDAGAEIVKRPKRLATDKASADEAILHAIDYILRIKKAKIDIVVLLQITSPLRTSDDISNAIELFIAKEPDSLFSAAILEDSCIWGMKNGRLNSVTFNYKNRLRRQDKEPYYLENGSIYIFRPENIRQYNNRLGGKMIFYPMPFWKSYEIDSVKDMEICEYYMKNKILRKQEDISPKPGGIV